MNMYSFVLGILVVPLAVLGAVAVFASSVTIPNSFTANTPAVAADVNTNFAAVAAAVNDNDTRITNNDTRMTTLPLLRATGRRQTDFAVPSGLQHRLTFLPTSRDLAGKPYKLDFWVLVMDVSATIFEAPATPGDMNFDLIFNAGTPAESRHSFVVALDAIAGPKSVSITGNWPAAASDPTSFLLSASVDIEVTGATALVTASIVHTRSDLVVNP